MRNCNWLSIRAPVTVTIAFSIMFCTLVCEINGDGDGDGGGSCYDAKLCCSGRDSSCVVQKAPTPTPTPRNVVTEDTNERPCYCDHACLKLGDCCGDFKKTCKVADCLVSVWQKWSACDTNCGSGTMRRMRTILKQPANGGKRCPSLIQRRACLGTSCPPNPSSAIKEIAMLLPLPAVAITFANQTSIRKSNATAQHNVGGGGGGGSGSDGDEDEDDPFDVENDVDGEGEGGREGEASGQRYCVQFKVIKATAACRTEFLFSALGEGEKVCVLCDGEAMRPSLGYRCAGHGTTDRSTGWSALSAPHCHGKWVRLDAYSPPPTTPSTPSTQSSFSYSAKTPTTTLACRRLCAAGPRFVFV